MKRFIVKIAGRVLCLLGRHKVVFTMKFTKFMAPIHIWTCVRCGWVHTVGG